MTTPKQSGLRTTIGTHDFTKSLLPPGTSVWVELDLETEDAYGRLLAYLYTKSPTGTWVIDGQAVIQVNLAIAEAGFARTLNIEPNSLYVDLFEDAVLAAQESESGMWSTATPAERETDAPTAPPATEGAEANTESPVAAASEISIACILYNPSTEGDEAAEVVTLLLSSAMNTRGFNLYDEGSKTIIRLPSGDQPPGELKVLNPGKGIWNNGGDVIYLRRGEEIVDAWDYTDSVVSGEGITICRDP